MFSAAAVWSSAVFYVDNLMEIDKYDYNNSFYLTILEAGKVIEQTIGILINQHLKKSIGGCPKALKQLPGVQKCMISILLSITS